MRRNRIQTVLGVVLALGLLGLIGAASVDPDVSLSAANRGALLALIWALLGLERTLEKLLPVLEGAITGAVQELGDNTTEDDDECR